jgi:hypothetical protein
MIPYDREIFDPPAPLAEITLLSPRSSQKVTGVTVQLDSGTDITCLPKIAIEQLNIINYGSIRAKGIVGRSAIHKTLRINLSFAGQLFKNVEVIPIEDQVGFLGRDVLNDFVLTLDGPQLQWKSDTEDGGNKPKKQRVK